jgi:hypothetical protein
MGYESEVSSDRCGVVRVVYKVEKGCMEYGSHRVGD